MPGRPLKKKPAATYIAFANQGGVRDWRADDKDTIYFQDRNRRWFKAELIVPSFDLPFTQFIGIDAEPGDRLDKFSTIYIKGQRYAVPLVRTDRGRTAEEGEEAQESQGRGLIHNSPG